MPRTLLVGHPGVTWKDWLRENLAGQPLICLDPADPYQSPPGRLRLSVGDQTRSWRFYGSLDAQRAPHILLAALVKLAAAAPTAPAVQITHRPTPLLRQFLQATCEVFRPERILVAAGTKIDRDGFPIGPEDVDLAAAPPPLVASAQHKAQWIKLLDQAVIHTLNMDQLTLEGVRLGSGKATTVEELRHLGLSEVLHVETSGATALVVSEEPLDERSMGRISNHFEVQRSIVVSPASYQGLLCSFARPDGEDFGMGVIDRIDFASREIHVRNTAEPGSAARLLRVGALRLSSAGVELGELKPWQV